MSASAIAAKPSLLILGTGWGGTSLLRALRHPRRWDITIASARDHMLFTPLLASTATGALEHRSILEPIRPLATSRHATFLNASVHQIHSANNLVHLTSPSVPSSSSSQQPGPLSKSQLITRFQQPYDVLVVAVGAAVNTYDIPHVTRHAFFLKEMSDARLVRRRMHDCFETASLPVTSLQAQRALLTFVVCGAGPTGVELCAELSDWLADVAKSRRYHPGLSRLARVVLVEAGGHVLSAFDDSLRNYALSRLQAAQVDVRLGVAVRRVERDAVVLGDATCNDEDEGEEDTDGGKERMPCGMIVWTAGIAPRPVIRNSDLPLISPTRSHIAVDDRLLAVASSSDDLPTQLRKPVFAIGDCARNCAHPLVPIAQVAEQQGIYLANVLDKLSSDACTHEGWKEEGIRKWTSEYIHMETEPFRFASRGMLAYVGGWRGVASVVVSTSKSAEPVQSSGWTAWLLWRFAYLSKLGSLRNKMQVPLDWLKTALFGRDVSSF